MIKPYVISRIGRKLPINWVKKDEGSWLAQNLIGDFIIPPINSYCTKIEQLAEHTNQKGNQPLWEGYHGNNIGSSSRKPNTVRSVPAIGNLFAYLVQEKKPEIIVEFGTAFGVSGMYFLAGLNKNEKGSLLTFDPNEVWAKLAKENLLQISNRFKLTVGTFEENIDNILLHNQNIDIAFIDAIHTKEFVIPQLEIVIARAKKGSIIILDDINFSADMINCWEEVSNDNRFISSLSIGDRVGMLELK
ncbi:class I SAM-dependent methyltransferase [Gelidibacter sp.]|uniref:O-methyltransferase n=1 Tax=Gelidibacter sp. TaxID=2018083 RepID=UPI003267BAE7